MSNQQLNDRIKSIKSASSMRVNFYPSTGSKLPAISTGACISAKNGSTDLHIAAHNGVAKDVWRLLDEGADPNAKNKFGCTPLALGVCGIANGHSRVLIASRLIAAGADVNTQDRFGATPLHRAAEMGREDIISCLLSAGANPNALDNNNATPLHKAATRGLAETVNLLLAAGANPELKTKSGKTPVDYACNKFMISNWVFK